jgi:hypothetical protein
MNKQLLLGAEAIAQAAIDAGISGKRNTEL